MSEVILRLITELSLRGADRFVVRDHFTADHFIGIAKIAKHRWDSPFEHFILPLVEENVPSVRCKVWEVMGSGRDEQFRDRERDVLIAEQLGGVEVTRLHVAHLQQLIELGRFHEASTSKGANVGYVLILGLEVPLAVDWRFHPDTGQLFIDADPMTRPVLRYRAHIFTCTAVQGQ